MMGNFEIWLERLLVPLDDPGSRLFHLNILAAFGLVTIWILWLAPRRSGKFWPELRRLTLRRRYWWNRSTKLDYQVYFLNGAFKVFLFIPFLDFSFQISRFVSVSLVEWHGDFLNLHASGPLLVAFTILAFVWDDLLRFTQHLLMHKVPWLWRIHTVHHSAKILTPVTLFRNHPLESAIATLRNALSLGVMTGIFIFVFGSIFSVITLFGVNILGFLFNLLGANLRHSHVPLSFGPWVERILISPRQHQIHHSIERRHYDCNYGVSLALWDQLFGTLVKSEDETGQLRFGMRGQHRQSLRAALWPF